MTAPAPRPIWVQPATPEENARYRAGKCRTCGQRGCAAGMTRCLGCNAQRTQ